eukprot:sb/3461689/
MTRGCTSAEKSPMNHKDDTVEESSRKRQKLYKNEPLSDKDWFSTLPLEIIIVILPQLEETDSDFKICKKFEEEPENWDVCKYLKTAISVQNCGWCEFSPSGRYIVAIFGPSRHCQYSLHVTDVNDPRNSREKTIHLGHFEFDDPKTRNMSYWENLFSPNEEFMIVMSHQAGMSNSDKHRRITVHEAPEFLITRSITILGGPLNNDSVWLGDYTLLMVQGITINILSIISGDKVALGRKRKENKCDIYEVACDRDSGKKSLISYDRESKRLRKQTINCKEGSYNVRDVKKSFTIDGKPVEVTLNKNDRFDEEGKKEERFDIYTHIDNRIFLTTYHGKVLEFDLSLTLVRKVVLKDMLPACQGRYFCYRVRAKAEGFLLIQGEELATAWDPVSGLLIKAHTEGEKDYGHAGNDTWTFVWKKGARPALVMDVDQTRYLDAAKEAVKREAFNMQRCLDKSQLMDGLRHATEMLNELRTSILTPKNYYELYMMVTMELTHLNMYMSGEFIKENKIADLYELVQHAGNILPRLYLLITVGVVYIRSEECSRKDILQDLVEMCRGVQHPLRGLFLRNFLLTSTRDVLPDDDTQSTDGGTIDDSINFILLNFCEMNKLWVRMQHQGHTRDRAKREQERLELKLLVGTNLERLSRLEGVTVERYEKQILPAVLKQLVNCKDSIAQEYLMDCIIQVFPDEFHLRTLENTFLDTCCQPQSQVNVRNIIISIIGRLSNFAQADPSNIPEDIKLFDIFSVKVTQIIQSRTEMPPEDILVLQSALIKLALNVYPAETGYVNQVLQNTLTIFQTEEGRAKGCSNELGKLLRVPVDHYQDILTVLELDAYPKLFSFLELNTRKDLCVYIAEHVIETGTLIYSHDQVFPDEFHLRTLENTFLDTCCQPQSQVNVRNIIISIIGRLSNFAQADPSNIPEDIKLFDIFSVKVTQIIQQLPHASKVRGCEGGKTSYFHFSRTYSPW